MKKEIKLKNLLKKYAPIIEISFKPKLEKDNLFLKQENECLAHFDHKKYLKVLDESTFLMDHFTPIFKDKESEIINYILKLVKIVE